MQNKARSEATNRAIQDFVSHLMQTLDQATTGANWIAKMPVVSPPVNTIEEEVGPWSSASTSSYQFTDDSDKLAEAKKMVSDQARITRINTLLDKLKFDENLQSLYATLQQDLTYEDKQYLMLNLESYLAQESIGFYSSKAYKTHAYTIPDTNDSTRPIIRYVSCPIGELSVKLERNQLRVAALQRIIGFQKRQRHALQSSDNQLPFIDERNREFISPADQVAPTATLPTLYNALINCMFIPSPFEKSQSYPGLSQFKADSDFVARMRNHATACTAQFTRTTWCDTIAYKMAATSRSFPAFAFFQGTQTQKMLDDVMRTATTSEKNAPSALPSAPPLAIAQVIGPEYAGVGK